MNTPKARIVPTALLANRGGRQPSDGMSSVGVYVDATALAPAVPVGDPSSAGLQLDTQARPPEHLYELALTTVAMGFHTAAMQALRDCTARAPDHAPGWRKLAELFRLSGDDVQAEAADAAAQRAFSVAARWKGAIDVRSTDRLEDAEQKLRQELQGKTIQAAMATLRDRLVERPVDAVAMRLLARIEATSGDEATSNALRERALDVCPGYVGVRQEFSEALVRSGAHAAAAPHTQWLTVNQPGNAQYRELHAHVLTSIGEIDASLDILKSLLRDDPGEARYWAAYAKVMHFLDQRDECSRALRKCLSLHADMGEAYWGLAELKGKFITQDDIAAMRALLKTDTLRTQSRLKMLFALGHALEQIGDYSASFAAYEEGRRLALTSDRHQDSIGGGTTGRERHSDTVSVDDLASTTEPVRRRKAVFSRKNFRTRLMQAPSDEAHDTPIFVVGLPRSGSTLIEQILASHSKVEGTRELPLIGNITHELTLSRLLQTPDAYPECLLDMPRQRLAMLGARYIDRSRSYRKTKRAWFVDKEPWNWLEVGLIHLILPQARIIDIRREPMAACFSIFKQLIGNFQHGLAGLGRYYNLYVSLMQHWELVLPGRVHFMQYEHLVEDTENEIRRMLDYCGLPFEDGCLRYWETERAIATPSAQQVRRPIYRDALQQWRNFEPWLAPLREELSTGSLGTKPARPAKHA